MNMIMNPPPKRRRLESSLEIPPVGKVFLSLLEMTLVMLLEMVDDDEDGLPQETTSEEDSDGDKLRSPRDTVKI